MSRVDLYSAGESRRSRFWMRRRTRYLSLLVLMSAHAWGQSGWPTYPNNATISVTGSGNVGIGIANPQGGLHSKALATWWSAYNLGASFVADGTRNNSIAMLDWTGSNAIALSNMGGDFTIWAAPPLNDSTTVPTSLLRVLRNGNVGIGTYSPQYPLAVNGTMGAREVIVTGSGWADYVFQPGYRLWPLSEVSAFIEKHGHLPGIPTEAEVKEKGVGVGEMQAKLLAKVEELTLHLIQQNREKEELRVRLAQLEKMLGADAPRRSNP